MKRILLGESRQAIFAADIRAGGISWNHITEVYPWLAQSYDNQAKAAIEAIEIATGQPLTPAGEVKADG